MVPEFGSTLYTVLGIAIVISALLMFILFALGRMFGNKETEQTSKEELVEIAISIFLIGIVSYLITNPIQAFTCGLLINNILGENINCESPSDREQYLNKTFDIHLNMSYTSVASDKVRDNLDNLLKISLSSRRYFIFGSITGDALLNDLPGILGGINPENPQQAQTNDVASAVEGIRQELSGLDAGLSTGFSYMPCRHYGLIYDSVNNLLAQINQYRSIIYMFKEMFSNNVYPIFIVGFFGIGGLLRMIKLTRKVGSFMISFSIALSILPMISIFFLNVLPIIYSDFNASTMGVNASNRIAYLTHVTATPTTCMDIRLNGFTALYNEILSEISNPRSVMIQFSVYSMVIILSLGLSLLATISITVGINQLLGIDVSPFVLSYIARVA